MVDTKKQVEAKEAIKNIIRKYHIHEYLNKEGKRFKAVGRAFELDTWDAFRKLVILIEGKTAQGTTPELANTLLNNQGGNTYLIVGKLKKIIQEVEEEDE